MRRLPTLFMALLAATTMMSCGGGSGETKVEKITLAKDDGSGNVGETVESLTPADRQFHATGELDKGADAKVKADLIAVETAQGNNVKVLSNDYEVGGIENQVHLKYSLPNDWPAGSYKIDVYVNDKLAQTKEFKIQ